MEINEYFKREYLTAGMTYDNFIFEKCPKEILGYVKEFLLQNNKGNVKPCIVILDGMIDRLVGNTLNSFDDDFHKKILARDFITAMVMREVLKYLSGVEQTQELINMQINAFLSNDKDCVKDLHASSFQPFNVKTLSSSIGKIELDFILEDVQNKYLQQAVNVFISCREPYSVKVFTNNNRLSSYYDLNGNIIESPHDFMTKDINLFLEKDTGKDCTGLRDELVYRQLLISENVVSHAEDLAYGQEKEA